MLVLAPTGIREPAGILTDASPSPKRPDREALSGFAKGVDTMPNFYTYLLLSS